MDLLRRGIGLLRRGDRSAPAPASAPPRAPEAARSSEAWRVDALEQRAAGAPPAPRRGDSRVWVPEQVGAAEPAAPRSDASGAPDAGAPRARRPDVASQPLREWPASPSRVNVGARILVLFAVFLVIASLPLFVTRRSSCVVGSRTEIHWSLAMPLAKKHAGPRCQVETGGTALRDAIGVK